LGEVQRGVQDDPFSYRKIRSSRWPDINFLFGRVQCGVQYGLTL